MANALYDTFKEALLQAEVTLDSDNIIAELIDTLSYTYSAADADFGTDVAAGAKIAASSALTTVSVTNGVFDTADFTWSTVSGNQSEAIILYDDTVTTPVADQLMAYYDTGMTGMPVTPNGGDINVTVNGSGWFTL